MMKSISGQSIVARQPSRPPFSLESEGVIGETFKVLAFLNSCCEVDGNLAIMDDEYAEARNTAARAREAFYDGKDVNFGEAGSHWESARLQAIACYWSLRATKNVRVETLSQATWLFNFAVGHFRTIQGSKLQKDQFARLAIVCLRLALKFEERPDFIYNLGRLWDLLPLFEDWHFDRSETALRKLEFELLRALGDCIDRPHATHFLDRYLTIGGWPKDVAKQYRDLGHYLIALASFASRRDFTFVNVNPSLLAAASLCLAVKIINGDTHKPYEFFPKRFEAYAQYSFKTLQPVMKGLSVLLRKKPYEARVLATIYPDWGDHEWQ